MTSLATVSFLPGVGDGPGERPDTYVDYLISVGLKANTIRMYASHVRMAEKRCRALGSDLLTAHAGVLAAVANQLSPSHSSRAHLRCALKHFYEWQDRRDAPLRAVRVPPQPAMVCKALSPDDAAKLEQTARGWWPQGAVILLGLYLGLRREEIAIAEWERFDRTLEWYRVR